MFNANREVVGQYRTNTYFKNSVGTSNAFNFNGNKISGKHLDVNGNVLSQKGYVMPSCGFSSTTTPIDKNISLYYSDGLWHQIGSPTFFDDFNDGDYSGWTVPVGGGNWRINNGELNTSGVGDEVIYRNCGWNSNDYLTFNVNINSGNDFFVRIFDGSNDYYFQTFDAYSNLHLYVNGAWKKSVALVGITPNNWNIWKVNQSGSNIEIYINNSFKYNL